MKIHTYKTCLLLVVLMVITFTYTHEKAFASEWDDAQTFYDTYGNTSVFHASSKTDGLIYCATKGNATSSSVKYRLIGLKFKIMDSKGASIQNIYFQLGGKYLTLIDFTSKNGYKYSLYGVALSDLKKRMNSKALSYLEVGKCCITVDSCMTYTEDGKAKGQVDDNGKTTGSVYTTYAGISKAKNWSKTALSALKNYFNKSVSGLFYTVTLDASTGIASVEGQGKYCYGTKVTISAKASKGYYFYQWTGKKNSTSISYSFYVNEKSNWVAHARVVETVISYHSNTLVDSQTYEETLSYTDADSRYYQAFWEYKGYHIGGWSKDSKATSWDYEMGEIISADWLLDNSPSVDLYAIWIPNTYKLEYKGKLVESLADQQVKYNQTIKLPENGDFLGWSLDIDSDDTIYKAKEEAKASNLADKLGLENVDGATISLYALWPDFPLINAPNQYYSLEEAASGRVTEAVIASHVTAYDNEDGNLKYKVTEETEETGFYFTDYDKAIFTDLREPACIEIEVLAINSSRQKAKGKVKVYIVDTSVVQGSKLTGTIRFISNKFYEDDQGNYVKEKAGGLLENSCWKSNYKYKSMLELCLEN